MSYLRIKTATRPHVQYTIRFNNGRWHVLNTRTYEVINAFFPKEKWTAEQWAKRLA